MVVFDHSNDDAILCMDVDTGYDMLISMKESSSFSSSMTASMIESALFSAEIGSAPEIDLHGLAVHEALNRLDSFLNHEFVAGSEAVKVIHGRGSGKLEASVLSFLKDHDLVAGFRGSSAPGQQGGVTIVALYSVK